MNRFMSVVACCVVSCALWAGDASVYLGSLDTNPVVPTAVVVNTSNNKIYVGGSSGLNARVKVINCATGQVTELTIPDATAIPAMAYDPSTNRVYAATTSSRIGVIDCSNDSVLSNIVLNSGAGVNNIERIAVNPGNRLVLSGRDPGRYIVSVALPGGADTYPAGADTTCTAIAFDASGNAYVAENSGSVANDVFKVTSGGVVTTHLTTTANHAVRCLVRTNNLLFASTSMGTIFFRPDSLDPQGTVNFAAFPAPSSADDLSSMAFNATTNKLYVINATAGKVYVVDTTAMPPTVTASIPVTLPKSIVVNPNTNRVFVITTSSFVAINGSTDSIVNIDSNASGSFDDLQINAATNRIYAMDSASPKLYAYDGALNTVTAKDGSGGVAAYDFSSSLMALNSTTGKVYAVDVGMGMQPTSTVREINGSTVVSATAGPTPVDIGINGISNKVYVANQGNSTVTRLDAGNGLAVKNIQLNAGGLTGQNPVALAVDATVNRIFVANRGPGMGAPGNVSVVYGGSDEVIATLPLDGEPTAICVLPSRSKLYVATKQGDQGFVTVFSTLENKLIKKVNVQESPQQLLPAGSTRVYVSSLTSAAVQAIDAAGDNVIGSITCGNSNNIMSYNAANGMLYVVSRSSSGNLTVIDVNSNSTRQAPSSAGSSPSSIVVSPSGNRVYIGQQSGVVTVLDGGVNPFFLAQINSFNTQGVLNVLAIDTVRSKLYIGGNGFRAVDIESDQFDAAAGSLTGPTPALFFNNSPQFTLNALGGTGVYYQLNSTQGTWTRATSGPLTLSSVDAGSHVLYAFSTRDLDATLGSYAQGVSTPVIDKIKALPFTVHDGGLPLPTLNNIEDQVINEDQGQVLIDFFGVTPGPLATALTAGNISFVTSNSNPAGLISIVSPVDFDSARGKGTLRVTPGSNLFGDVLITVVVTDPSTPAGVQPSQLTVTRTFKLTVQPVNDAPTFNVGANITVSEAANVSTTPGFISGIVLGPANESTQAVAEYIVTATQPTQFKVQPAINASTGTLTFTPANNTSTATPITINVQLKDNGGTSNGGTDTSTLKTFSITLMPVADTLIVTNTTDSNTANSNSLRDCINRARSGDTITFDPDVFDLTNSNAATVINVTGAGLPALIDGNVTIEASDRRVTINGSGTVDAAGLLVQSSNNVIRGLNIVGFPGPGLRIQGGASNIIGGARTSNTGPNGQGLRLSGNGSFGLEIRGATATANIVKGCWIGLDAAGTASEANLAGILIQDGAKGNTIGGTGTGEANVIGGNKFEGTTFSGTGTDDNIFIGNEVGVSAVDSTTSTGSLSRKTAGARDLDTLIAVRSAVGNGSAGLFLSRGTRGSRVGGDGDTDGNAVANNGGNGVEVRASGSRRNAAKKNRIAKNKSGGIALFDNANDGITPPTFTSVTKVSTTGSLSRETSTVVISGSASSTTGTVEIFNDSGSQGETFVTRASVAGGLWTTTVDVSDVLNITATLTDDNGNTSAFAVFGRSPGDDSGDTDTDGDGISDAIEALAGTDPNAADSAPESGGALVVDKMQIALNFAKADKDSLKCTFRLVLPEGYINTDATLAVRVADSTETLTLNSKGSSPKALASAKLTGGSTTAAPANTGARIQYAITKKTLLSALASAGLDNETTAKEGESLSIPVAVAITSGTTTTVYTGTVLVIYKATTGKTGKAKQSL